MSFRGVKLLCEECRLNWRTVIYPGWTKEDCVTVLEKFSGLAVAHHQFKNMGAQAIHALGKPEHVLYDLKYLLPIYESDLRL